MKRWQRAGRSWRLVNFLVCLIIISLLPASKMEVAAAAEPLPSQPLVRVAVAQAVAVVEVAADKAPYRIRDKESNRVVAYLQPGESIRFTNQGNRIGFMVGGNQQLLSGAVVEPVRAVGVRAAGGRQVNSDAATLTALGRGGVAVSLNSRDLFLLRAGGVKDTIPAGGEMVTMASAGSSIPLLKLTVGQVAGTGNDNGEGLNPTRRYRGVMEIEPENSAVTVVNVLPLEQYLYGVLPSEMSSQWPLEALKAQAVAARSYALAAIQAAGNSRYQLLATQSSQVYKGYDVETPATTRAVDETSGQVLTYRGKVIQAYFHSSSGGYTEKAEEVWVSPLPYIVGKPDPFDRNDKHYNWSVTMTVRELTDQLASRGYQLVTVTDLVEQARTSSGMRVKKLAVTGINAGGQTETIIIANADNVRRALGLKSAFFTMEKSYDSNGRLLSVTFKGNGWGHGLGMSQYGARGMALKGYKYHEILSYYFNDVMLSSSYGR